MTTAEHTKRIQTRILIVAWFGSVVLFAAAWLSKDLRLIVTLSSSLVWMIALLADGRGLPHGVTKNGTIIPAAYRWPEVPGVR